MLAVEKDGLNHNKMTIIEYFGFFIEKIYT